MLKTLSHDSNGRPSIVNASDLVNANVTPLMNRKMADYLDMHCLRAVCDFRGRLVVRFKPSAVVDGDFGGDAA